MPATPLTTTRKKNRPLPARYARQPRHRRLPWLVRQVTVSLLLSYPFLLLAA